MRRSEYEITDKIKIEEFLKNNDTIRVGFNVDEGPYIVPVTYGYDYDEELTFYFHGASIGRKFDLAKTSPRVGFELDCAYPIKSAEQACNFSIGYESIIGTGTISLVTDIKEKSHSLNRIMYNISGKEQWDYPEKMLEGTAVFKLTVESFSMKSHEVQ